MADPTMEQLARAQAERTRRIKVIVAYFGRTSYGVLHTHCVTCCDKYPLSGYDGRDQPDRVYGDPDFYAGDSHSDDDCHQCGVSLRDLSERCQREHAEQQARFARLPVLALVEYGVPAAVRCRVY